MEAGWEVSGCRSDAALTITDCTPLAKVHLRAPWNGAMAKALGVPFGRAARDGADGLGWRSASGPGEWLVLAPPGTAAGGGQPPGQRWRPSRRREEFVSVTDLTHGRALVRVTGRTRPDLLARLCADRPARRHGARRRGAARRRWRAWPPTSSATTRPRGPSYLLHCERSSGQYLFDALVSAGESLGIGVDGFRLPGI